FQRVGSDCCDRRGLKTSSGDTSYFRIEPEHDRSVRKREPFISLEGYSPPMLAESKRLRQFAAQVVYSRLDHPRGVAEMGYPHLFGPSALDNQPIGAHFFENTRIELQGRFARVAVPHDDFRKSVADV